MNYLSLLTPPAGRKRVLLRLSHATLTILLFVAVCASVQQLAFATPYVDPGSGLLLCQSVSAVFAGAVYYFRRRIRTLLHSTSRLSSQEHAIDHTTHLQS